MKQFPIRIRGFPGEIRYFPAFGQPSDHFGAPGVAMQVALACLEAYVMAKNNVFH